MTQVKQATCTDLMAVAECELSAFICAVTELFGAEQAALSAEDWLDELTSKDNLPGLESRAWRLVTIAASARLASRIVDGVHDAKRSAAYYLKASADTLVQ